MGGDGRPGGVSRRAALRKANEKGRPLEAALALQGHRPLRCLHRLYMNWYFAPILK